jgi:Flp pilus assembly protein TadB
MTSPPAQDYLRISAIAAALCVLALVVAFAGAGLIAFVVLAVAVGPISFYANQRTRRRPRHPSQHRVET